MAKKTILEGELTTFDHKYLGETAYHIYLNDADLGLLLRKRLRSKNPGYVRITVERIDSPDVVGRAYQDANVVTGSMELVDG